MLPRTPKEPLDAVVFGLASSGIHSNGLSLARRIADSDESLLGGAVVQIGSTVYDGSVSGQLEALRQRLTE